MSIFLSSKHKQTILLFIIPKKLHILSKIAYVIMCIYILVQQNTILAIGFFFYSKSFNKSPLSLFHVINLQLAVLHLLFGLRCSQAGFAVEAKLQNFRGQCCLKQDGTALHLLCCRWFTSLNIGDGAFVFKTTTKIQNTPSFVLGKARTSNVLLCSCCDWIS